MKRIFVIAVVAASFTACNNASTTTTDTDSSMNTTTVAPMPADTMASVPATTDTMAPVTYTPADGDVIYRDHKVYVMKNGAWVETNNDVTLDNGVVVYKTGTVTKDNQKIKLEEGEVVDKSGNFFDKAGHALKTAWGQTKDAVEDAGNAVGKTAKKVGNKIDTAIHH